MSNKILWDFRQKEYMTFSVKKIKLSFKEDPLEKGMETHSSIVSWTILWTEEPGGLQSIGSHRVRHD